MLKIGLTGGIGTGKSEVSRILKELGATVIDADLVGHEAYTPHTPIWQQVVDAFGEDILQPSGEVDRRKLGPIVFGDPEALAKLNAIMHPGMAKMIQERMERLRGEGTEVVVVEAAVLVEAGWQYLFDEIWITNAPEDQVVERVCRRSNLTEEQVMGRIRSQLPFEERSQHAQVTVMNSGGLDDLQWEVESLWNSRVKGKVN
jgi:dephospho-CoA kinase